MTYCSSTYIVIDTLVTIRVLVATSLIPVKEYIVLWANAQVLSYDVHVSPNIAAIDVGRASCRLKQASQHRPAYVQHVTCTSMYM